MDENATKMQRGKQWLEQLLKLAKIPAKVNVELDTSEPEADSYWLTIDETQLSPEQIQILLGPDGTVLDAIQYLANTILNLNQTPDQQASFTTELNGYRARRTEELKKMAEYAANQVRTTGEEFEMKSLSSAERRQVHTLLKECEDLETYSRGQEPDRRLVVQKKKL